MSGPDDDVEDPADLDTRERMMHATLQVLGEHGYAGLSIQRIADAADLSKSSIYHFYDGKDDLLLAFLDFMLARFQQPLADEFGDDPTEDLWTHIEFAIAGLGDGPPIPAPGDFEPGSGEPYVELRAQAVHDDAYRDRFTDIDDGLHDRLVDIVERGIETGEFRDVDPNGIVELLMTVMLGGLFRRATADTVDIDALRDELDAVLDARLYAAD